MGNDMNQVIRLSIVLNSEDPQAKYYNNTKYVTLFLRIINYQSFVTVIIEYEEKVLIIDFALTFSLSGK